MENQQQNAPQQPANPTHPVSFGAIYGLLGQLERDVSLQRPEDMIAKLTLAAVVSIAFDMRRLADFQTRQTFVDAQPPGAEQSPAPEEPAPDAVAPEPEPVAA